jgi:hypothetical protein
MALLLPCTCCRKLRSSTEQGRALQLTQHQKCMVALGVWSSPPAYCMQNNILFSFLSTIGCFFVGSSGSDS